MQYTIMQYTTMKYSNADFLFWRGRYICGWWFGEAEDYRQNAAVGVAEPFLDEFELSFVKEFVGHDFIVAAS